MIALATAPATSRTAAELLDQLGGIPPERVLVQPSPGHATEQDLIRLRDQEDRLCELVDGVLVEKGMGYYESRVAGVLFFFLETFLGKHDLGVVSGADGTVRLMPGLVRIPDLAFVSWERLPGHEIPSEPIPDLIPNLAVEVLSVSNTKREIDRKIGEYFHVGVQLVWVIDPPTRTAEVYTGPDQCTELTEKQSLKGGAVVPGFSLSLRRLFNRADCLRGS
ncbi:MAG TPA: Uma2 family endonuclease [Planctomycetales bacterium]|jgi:Uma2 family endonuclease|nr:Uma2 family endonuclease [Planctomycetales bacterium]